MVVIFGFGRGKGKDLGEVAPAVCPNCHNQVFLHHVRSKKSVRLYFVPVVPYGTDDYLVCPVCSQGLQVSAPQLPHLRTMAGATASFRAGRLTETQYQAQAARFWRQLGLAADGPQPLTLGGAGGGQAPASGRPASPAASPAGAGPPPRTAPDDGSWISQLQELAQMHDRGVLSDAEYEAAKRRIVEQK
jgi:Short C-terminal domain